MYVPFREQTGIGGGAGRHYLVLLEMKPKFCLGVAGEEGDCLSWAAAPGLPQEVAPPVLLEHSPHIHTEKMLRLPLPAGYCKAHGHSSVRAQLCCQQTFGPAWSAFVSTCVLLMRGDALG